MQIKVIFGPPGTGKTRRLIEYLGAMAGTMKGRVLYVSHTKAAAIEAVSRWSVNNIANRVDIQTLHSWCFQAVGVSKAQVVDNSKMSDFMETIGLDIEDDGVGKKFVEILSLARSSLVPITEAYEQSEHPGTKQEFTSFCIGYESWKQLHGYVDFNDMLHKGAASSTGEIPALLIDEAQDLTPLHWMVVDNIVKRNNDIKVFIAGDDDQCQPKHTVVSTNLGNINIEDLDPSVHRVVSYSSKKGYKTMESFKISSRAYEGDLITVTSDPHSSRYTPNHRCLARFDVSDHQVANGRVVYLMQKGKYFRLGETKAFTKNINGVMFYPLARLRQEGADKLWVLKYVEDPLESRILEQTYAWEFGIPTLIFSYKKLGLTDSYGPAVYDALVGKIDFRERATKLLYSLGLDIGLPWSGNKVGGQKNFEVYAANLLPGLMTVGHLNEQYDRPIWKHFTMSRAVYSGTVYSLDVDRTETYYADGIWTHNSIYTFTGANPHGMIEFVDRFGGEIEVLAKSYRVPKPVHGLAQKIIGRVSKRVPKEYEPRDDGDNKGSVQRMSGIEDMDHSIRIDRDTMILYSDRFLREDVESMLLDRCLPYTSIGGQPAPLDTKAGKAIAIASQTTHTDVDMKKLYSMLNHKGQKSWQDTGPTVVLHCLKERKLSFVNAIRDHHEYLQNVVVDGRRPIRISTIHSSKGMEADDIHLYTGQSSAAIRQAEIDPDAQHRLFYVAVTRARDNLHLYEGDNGYEI